MFLVLSKTFFTIYKCVRPLPIRRRRFGFVKVHSEISRVTVSDRVNPLRAKNEAPDVPPDGGDGGLDRYIRPRRRRCRRRPS